MDKEIYFNDQALVKFLTVQGKTLEKVICHLWHNSININETLDIIDNIELIFTNNLKLTISCNKNGDGLDVIDFDYKKTADEIEIEFEKKIKIYAINASSTKMWEDLIGKILKKVRLTKSNNFYKADSVILDFGEEKREISINPLDGLIIDYFEE